MTENRFARIGLLATMFIVGAANNSPSVPKPADDLVGIGKWRVEFANRVIENCEIRADGTANVLEPLRESAGDATMHGGTMIIKFRDDRTERWTPVGDRMVVEHWFPSSKFPAGRAVMGIAERSR